VLIAPLLLLLALAVLQVALLMHARATLTSAATEGARAGALSGADPRAGISRATALVEQNVSGAVVRQISAERDAIDGLAVLTVRISAEVPGLGLLGATRLDVEGHALIESAR
jgi:Flp pilus assembly protein TadG